ncbi:hypothetical protein [Nocardia sp. NBC_01329]|uniref:hypothetical protein n=1 Tax=Nocardia sp. NBC_01329 TaxID=2903594 RepID=UPI002E107252|nr:hypothetical protein OG405_08630 [Nocardia sp. NBC_01329]
MIGRSEEHVVLLGDRGELGLGIDTPTCLLPRFRYSATAPDGTQENELCPVFWARADGPVHVGVAEVMDWRRVPWPDFAAAAGLRWPVSPWAADQVPQLAAAPGFSLWTDGR